MYSHDFLVPLSELLKAFVLPPRRELTASELDTRRAVTALISRRTLVRFAKDCRTFGYDPMLRTIVKICAGFEVPLFCGDERFQSVREFLKLAGESAGKRLTRIGTSISRHRQHVDASIYSPGIRIKMACALADGLDKPLRLTLPPDLVALTQRRTFPGPELRAQGRTLTRARAPMTE